MLDRQHTDCSAFHSAHFLLKDEIDDGVSYEELVSIHYSAQRLAEQVERGMHVVRERERYLVHFQQLWNASAVSSCGLQTLHVCSIMDLVVSMQANHVA